MTQCEDEPWNAVSVTETPSEDYYLGPDKVDHVALYEFDQDFVDYLNEAEFESEVALSKTDKRELSTSLSKQLGDLAAYCAQWAEETDDIAEIYGSSVNDDVVEVYSPPRICQSAAARGLKAELSFDLTTGYDLNQQHSKGYIRKLLAERRPKLLIASPPRTKFSPF